MTTKKNIKVRDLKPKKDAKGGGAHPVNNPSVNHVTTNTPTTDKFTTNQGTSTH